MEAQWGSNFQSKTLPEVSNDLDVPQEDLTEENSDVWDDSALITAWDHAVKEYQSFHSIKTEKTTNKIDNIKNKGVDRDDESALKSSDDKKVRGKTSMGSKEASVAGKRVPSYHSQSSYMGYPPYSYHQYPSYYSYPPPPPPKAGSFPEKPTNAEAKSSTDQTQKEKVDDSSVEETDHIHTQDSYTHYGHGSDSATGDNSYYSAYGWYNNYPPPPPPPQFYYQTPPIMDPNVSYFPGWRSMQPPKPQTAIPPPMIDDDALSNLLMAWYYSGYYTGLFQ
ncbi:10206_t:CDS:2, partial [Dentiscutata heterogama]